MKKIKVVVTGAAGRMGQTIIKKVLRDKGLTIVGAKKILNNNKKLYLDESYNWSINRTNFETVRTIKAKVKRISKIVNELKDLK